MKGSVSPGIQGCNSISPEMGAFEASGNQFFKDITGTPRSRSEKQRINKRPLRSLSAYDLNNPYPLMRNPERITSPGCMAFRNELDDCFQERLHLEKEVAVMESQLQESENLFAISRYLLIGHLVEWFERNCDIKKQKLLEIEKGFSQCSIKLDEHIDLKTLKDFKDLYNHFTRLSSSEKICNIFSSRNDGKTPATANKLISKDQVSLRFGKLEILSTKFDALRLENVDYGNIFIYPYFLVLVNNRNKVGVVAINEVEITFSTQYYLEETVPSDTLVTGQAHAKRNKYGNPHLDPRNEQELAVCLYGVLEINTPTGLHEKYCFSNHNRTEAFVDAFQRYQKSLRMKS